MSAARFRRAMNAPSGSAWPQSETISVAPAAGTAALPAPIAPFAGASWWQAIRARHAIVLLAVLVYPLVATPFFTYQIGGQALVLGLIALSLTLLAGYGGMVSLGQMTVAGIAGYCIAIFGSSAAVHISLGWPWWLAATLAVLIATVAATGIGWLSVRTEGIYTIMITLAIGVAFYYLCLQNYTLFNGFAGFQKVQAPTAFGLDWREPLPFYYLALAAALGGYLLVSWLVRTPFGLALQGVRDNARRMNALGFAVTAHRIAAYAVAGFLAAIGGVLLTWYSGLIVPGSIGTGALLKILVIAVLGGIRHPIGAFIGALVYVLLQTFAMDVLGDSHRDRYNLVIGSVFLLIVLFSPDGLLGWWAWVRRRFARTGPQHGRI